MHKESFYGFLFLTLGFNLLHKIVPNEAVSWHPYFDITYSMKWYFSLLQYNLKPVLYLFAMKNFNRKSEFQKATVFLFLTYEWFYVVDFIIAYSQMPFRTEGAILMAFITVFIYGWEVREEQ